MVRVKVRGERDLEALMLLRQCCCCVVCECVLKYEGGVCEQDPPLVQLKTPYATTIDHHNNPCIYLKRSNYLMCFLRPPFRPQAKSQRGVVPKSSPSG